MGKIQIILLTIRLDLVPIDFVPINLTHEMLLLVSHLLAFYLQPENCMNTFGIDFTLQKVQKGFGFADLVLKAMR